MWFILAIRHPVILVQHAVVLETFMLGVFPNLLVVGWYDTSPCLLLVRYLCRCITTIIGQRCVRGCKSFGLIQSSLSVIFCLHGGQKIALLFVGDEVIILIFVFHFILHGCWNSVLSWNVNLIVKELFFMDGPIYIIVLLPLHQRWR